MQSVQVMDVLREGLYLVVIMLCVIIVPSLVVGLIISMFQAATPVNEQTLSFFPRLILMLLVLAWAGPWLGHQVYDYTLRLVEMLPTFYR